MREAADSNRRRVQRFLLKALPGLTLLLAAGCSREDQKERPTYPGSLLPQSTFGPAANVQPAKPAPPNPPPVQPPPKPPAPPVQTYDTALVQEINRVRLDPAGYADRLASLKSSFHGNTRRLADGSTLDTAEGW